MSASDPEGVTPLTSYYTTPPLPTMACMAVTMTRINGKHIDTVVAYFMVAVARINDRQRETPLDVLGHHCGWN